MKPRIDLLRDSWKKAHPIQRKGIAIVAIAFVILVIAVIAKEVGFAMEERGRRQALAEGPRVQVAVVAPSAAERTLVLTGEARPYESVTLYAKVSGYLKSVPVDKGDAVEKGQLLAVIESPETNQDYDAAAADAANKQAIADRMKPLLEKKLVSQQEADQSFADASMAQARLQSLGATRGYEEIRAPFSGTVTARYIDPGALIQNAQTSQTSAQPLFVVSQTHRLRVYVYVDQGEAPFIHIGLPVRISLDERPDVQLDAAVTRFSGELDPRTRMLLTEVDIDNHEGVLVAGSFVKVAMKVKSPSYLQVPSEALVIRQAQDFVPVVTSSQTITYRPVVVADNDGQMIRLLSGVSAGEQVALSVGSSIEEGSKIQPVLPLPPPAAAPSAPTPPHK